MACAALFWRPAVVLSGASARACGAAPLSAAGAPRVAAAFWLVPASFNAPGLLCAWAWLMLAASTSAGSTVGAPVVESVLLVPILSDVKAAALETTFPAI